MKCFTHEQSNAVGICKSCFKAVCKECAVEVPNGLACSEECSNRVLNNNEMNERALKIYGIGKHKSKIPSTGVIIWFIFAAAMWAAFLVPYINRDYFNTGLFALAIGFTLIFGLVLYSARRTGLKC